MKKLTLCFLILFLFSCNWETKQIKQKEESKSLSWNYLQKLEQKDLGNDAKSYFLDKDYNNAAKAYEKLLSEWEKTPEIINNLFVSYIWILEYQKAVNIISLLINANWPSEWLVWKYIEKDSISENILSFQKKIQSDEVKDDEMYLNFAKNMYKAWDYYYDEDKEKYYFAIMLHYLSAYLALDDAIKLNPDNSEAYFYKWRLIMDIWSPMKLAEEELKKAVALKQDDFRYYYRLWNAYMHEYKNELARDTFLKWIELNDKYEKLHLNLWNVYFKLYEKDKWFESYDRGIKVCKELCDGFYNNLWNEYYWSNEFDIAKKWYEKAIEFNPNHENSKEKLRKMKGKL